MPEPHLRAADTDREAVARRLGEHMSAGRLTLPEYEDRMARAWSAKTYGDLAALTADLPPQPADRPLSLAKERTPAEAPPAGSCAGGRYGWSGHARAAWGGWLTTALIVLTIWLATSLSSGALQTFWPIWVIGPWGAVLLARTVVGAPARPGRRSLRR